MAMSRVRGQRLAGLWCTDVDAGTYWGLMPAERGTEALSCDDIGLRAKRARPEERAQVRGNVRSQIRTCLQGRRDGVVRYGRALSHPRRTDGRGQL